MTAAPVEGRDRAGRAVLAAARAEFTKIVTLRSVWLVTAGIVGLHVLVQAVAFDLYAAAVAGIAPDGTIEIFAGSREPAVPAIIESLGASSLQMTLFLPLLAVLIGGHEFRNRQLAVSVLAVPRRGRLLAAKVLATGGFLAGVAILIAAISTVFTYLAVKDWWPGLLLTPAAVGVQARFVGYAVLFGLAVLACTIIGRAALAGAGVMLALIAVTMTRVLAVFAPAVDALFPLSAGRNLLLNPVQNDLTAGPAHAASVLAGWAVVTLTFAAAVLHRRPAR